MTRQLLSSGFEVLTAMNKEWSELNKTMQVQLKKADTFKNGICTLFELRNSMMQDILSFRELGKELFSAMPFMNANGYHSKSIAYSLWHIFRIEDIVSHTLINDDEQIFFSGNYKERINSPIITTGNELVREQISDFSKRLDIDELYAYISDVKLSTEKILGTLAFDVLKKKISADQKEKLISLNVVSSNENAEWLINYWCGKDVRGLICMPLSRHWIMHTEASLRIRNKLTPA